MRMYLVLRSKNSINNHSKTLRFSSLDSPLPPSESTGDTNDDHHWFQGHGQARTKRISDMTTISERDRGEKGMDVEKKRVRRR